jgi:hypothetical protein
MEREETNKGAGVYLSFLSLSISVVDPVPVSIGSKTFSRIPEKIISDLEPGNSESEMKEKMDRWTQCALPIVKVIAYKFCWTVRIRNYVFYGEQLVQKENGHRSPRYGTRLIPKYSQPLDPPHFSLPTTFKL